MDNKKTSPLSHAVRRKSAGSIQLRSPMAKRSPQAPVSQKGWLLKQGSEGLMLWKKRWCVLAEHCLFYYKTSEEEKILGSILLPSYKVSPCTNDDRVYKKFAFKVEHANMRTYVFAAETREGMVQWMNALSLSTILQDISRDENGFAVTRQPDRLSDGMAVNGWLPHQPLYANAPPKPRRMGENSPEPGAHPANMHYHPHPYQRPNGFVHPTYVRAPNNQNYQHPNQFYQGYNQLAPAPAPSIPPHQIAPRRNYQPPRPHSADFLDYDAKKYYQYQETTVVKTTDVKMDTSVHRKRPKSSMDYVQNSDDRHYWSEERYAEKMRQSAMYLQQRIASPVRQPEPETFSRSASARLARQAPDDEESDEVQGYMGGEVSMKRLLEWKQRMLASPLTRKPSGSSSRGSAQNELSKFYKQQVLRELERQEARSREELGRRRTKPDSARYRSKSTDGRRSAASVTNRYNSYSSDDEDKEDDSHERTRRSALNGKTRRISEETKRKDNRPVAWSPDYENLAEFPAQERSGRASAPPIKSSKKSLKEDYSERSKTNSQGKSSTSGQTQNVVYPSHSAYINEDTLHQTWNEKLDESKLIKEFSYQYINENAPTIEKVHSLESPPENIVKSRIRQLGLEVKDLDDIKDISMKEPLKVATPSFLLNEALVSHLKSPELSTDSHDRRNNKNSIKTFALGTAKTPEPEPTNSLEKKSVRDLLADFEKKSQLAHERLENEKINEDSMGKRCVFSDTETLLYDTSSDTDEKKPPPDPSILDVLRRPECLVGESADQTEEEGDEEVAATLGRRGRYYSACRDISRKPEPKLKVLDGRLSVPESSIANDESESVCSTPTIDMIKDSLTKTLPQENIKIEREPEEHYMPMSPVRKLSAPPSDRSRSNSSLHSVLYGVEIEETYVEMGDNSSNEYLAKRNFATYNNTDVDNKVESHYDFLYKTSSDREPEYMEVNNLITALRKESKDKLNEEAPPTPPRSALPDILNSSAGQMTKSDSSDADDESSKDLDSLDTPRHPRFSLSDTFRPASYYLGMGAVIERSASENHDSSDSDLVSPPPIPTSPPPLEDLDTSLETENSMDLNIQASSTPTRKLKISDHDLSKRLWSKPKTANSKRQPVSMNLIESLDESDLSDSRLNTSLEEIGNRSGMAIDDEHCDINLDAYLKDLQLGEDLNPQTFSKDFRSYEMQRNLAENINKCVSVKNLIKSYNPENQQPEEAEYENLQAMFPPPPPELYESSDHSDRENSLAHNGLLDVPPPANYCDNNEASIVESPKVRFDPDTLLQKDIDAQAPYYYSDIMKTDVAGPSHVPSLRQRYQPLNNQREDLHEPQQGSKRNDIGRKVNPIASAEPEERSNVQKMTDELQSTTVVFMGDAEKSGSVDVRNLYESDTLQRKKCLEPVGILRVRTPDLHHPQSIVRNLYPHGLRGRNESESQAALDLVASSSSYGRISQSIEGILEEAVQRPNRRQCGDEVWDEDNQWRERLRRVSRSLDNLDETALEEPVVPSGRRSVNNLTTPVRHPPSGRRSVDTTRPKVMRGATYVNTQSRPLLTSDYENDPSRRVSKTARELPEDDDGVYERLHPDATLPERRVPRGEATPNWNSFLDQTSHPYIEPIDRERLRQWDLMSSGTGGDTPTAAPTPSVIPKEQTEKSSDPHSATALTSALLTIQPEASATGSVVRDHHMPPPPPPADPISSRPPSRPVPAIMLTRDSPRTAEPRMDYHTDSYQTNSPYHHANSPHNAYPTWDSYTPYDGRERSMYHDHRKPLSEYNEDYRVINQRPMAQQAHYVSQPMSGTLPHHKSSPVDGISPTGRNADTLPTSRSQRTLYRQQNSTPSQNYRDYHHNQGKREGTPGGSAGAGGSTWELDVSAGELLGRTHEELVLLLIQLRRQSAGVCKAMEACHIEIEAQARLAELETPKRMEHLQRLEELKRHLLELEKQYEKGKPLVNLVDNMVKLGSLYRGSDSPSSSQSAGGHVREKLEFNQKLQEQRMLAEERKEWDRLSPDQNQLQAKVQQLYKLDRLLQEESGTLQSLQQDKELLEKALGGLRHKLHVSKGNPLEADRCRQQQRLLQKELSRVRMLLAHNSKKLEETVSENARLEQELVILRQKLQANRLELSGRSSVSLLDSSTASTTQALEAELRRVQGLVGDLQRQRQELSVQVRQLTEKSDTLVQQIRPGPTGVAGAEAVPGKKKTSGTWYETDLDDQYTRDVGISLPSTPNDSPQHVPSPPKPQETSRSTTPIYINTDLNRTDLGSPAHSSTTESQKDGLALTPVELSEADDRMKRYYGIIPKEKVEIKTVRIVKRESERRQRDRDRSGNIGLPLTNTAQAKRVAVVDEVEEEHQLSPVQTHDPYANFHPTNPFLPVNLPEVQKSMSLPRGFGGKAPPPPARQEQSNSLRSALIKRNRVRFDTQQDWSGSDSGTISPRVDSPKTVHSPTEKPDRPLTAREQLFGAAAVQSPSPQLSPVYQSEAARQIVEEMARNSNANRRLVPKEKRRHHTMSNIRMFVDSNDTPGTSRARDDLDMERALRPRLNAPDVVRSTLSQRDLKYNETTIDSILGTPNKIVIPERYIPESEPILTAEEQLHRLRKADSIRKMLSETSALSTPDLSSEPTEEERKTSTLRKKVDEEKRQREHLLQLNQILAQQVMEKSKLVAVKALARLPLHPPDGRFDDDDLSPVQPLPLYQQRENFYS